MIVKGFYYESEEDVEEAYEAARKECERMLGVSAANGELFTILKPAFARLFLKGIAFQQMREVKNGIDTSQMRSKELKVNDEAADNKTDEI